MSRRRYEFDRLLDTWEIKNDHTGDVFKVPVRMFQKYQAPIQFSATLDDPHFDLAYENINELKAEVTRVLKEYKAKPWVKKLQVETQVEVDGKYNTDVKDQRKGQLAISWSIVEVSTDAAGRPMHRDPDEKWVRHEEIETGYDAETGYTTALLDYSEEMEQRLKQIVTTLHDLGTRVSDVLSPKKIEKTLLTAPQLLMAPIVYKGKKP